MQELKRFYLLDVARGIAAFAVIIWHYQHFYYLPAGKLPVDFSKADQPFYNIFWLFYEFGVRAPYFFFCLSGFIFFWLYLEKIRHNNVDARSFFILRFSRLFPLHLVTLLFVAIFQFVFIKLNGNFVIFHFNDLKHFFLNLFFVSYWGFENGESYNQSIWSVSAEVLVYSIFFLFASLKLNKLWHVLLLLLLTYPLSKINENIGQVIFGFFVGGGAYLVFDFLESRFRANRKAILVMVIFAIALTVIFLKGSYSEIINNIAIAGLLFPGIVLLLAFLQMDYLKLGESTSIIGDLTYSTYLIHFPIQLIVIGCSQYFGYQFEYGKLFFVIYFFALIIISWTVYKRFEMPAQQYIRQKFLTKGGIDG